MFSVFLQSLPHQCRVVIVDELCLVDEVVEETKIKAVQGKDAAAALPVAVTDIQSRDLMPHDAIEPSINMLFV